MGDERCGYVIAKRNRRCRMLASRGSIYCGEHLIHDQSRGADTRKRIPCPLDSSHTVFEDVLHKHLKKCNVAKRVMPSCYVPGINDSVSQGSPPDPHSAPNSSTPPSPHLTLASCPPHQLEDLIHRVELACKDHMTSLEEEFLSHPSMSDDLRDPNNGAAALKHLRQQSSIVGHLDKSGLLDLSKVSCYVEFGAGRGKLTGCIHRAIQFSSPDIVGADSTIQYVLVDRASCRRKVDGTHRAAKLTGATCHRLLMDIMDLDLSSVEAARGRGLVGVGKHLCGGATDLALRCIVRTLQNDQRGVAALCCHHRCTWEQLVGQEFLTQLGFTPEDCNLISHMTSWAVCGCRPPTKDEKEGADIGESKKWGYVPHPKEGVGLKCKRLLDLARVHYLQQNGLRTRLVHYVDGVTSLENVLLIATALCG